MRIDSHILSPSTHFELRAAHAYVRFDGWDNVPMALTETQPAHTTMRGCDLANNKRRTAMTCTECLLRSRSANAVTFQRLLAIYTLSGSHSCLLILLHKRSGTRSPIEQLSERWAPRSSSYHNADLVRRFNGASESLCSNWRSVAQPSRPIHPSGRQRERRKMCHRRKIRHPCCRSWRANTLCQRRGITSLPKKDYV